MNIKGSTIVVSLIIFFSQLSLLNAETVFDKAPPSSQQLKNPYKHNDLHAISSGETLYLSNCSNCHGRNAMGTGNIPALAKGLTQSTSDGALFWFITNGSPQNGMPASTLKEQEIWQITTFLKSLKNKPYSPPRNTNKILIERTSKTNDPIPKAPFSDYRFQYPGQVHKILIKDLPEPAIQTSAQNGPTIVSRPQNAWPKVPDGFKVQLYASGFENARLLRTAPNGDIFLADSSAGKIYVFRGLTPEGKPKITELFLSGLNQPYGIAFYPNDNDPKWIYIANTDSIVRYPYHAGDLHVQNNPQKIIDLPSSLNGHWTRDIQFSRDGKKLYVSVGSESNIDDPETTPAEKNRSRIFILNPDGSELNVYAYGIRNAGGGLAINPLNGELWCSVNERDGLGDNLVPDYITHVREGGFYGWPWWYMGGHQDPHHRGKHPELKKALIDPDVLIQPHNATLQLTFYEGTQFPPQYRGDIFAAQHGSWNRSVRTGYELIRIPLHQTGNATGEYEDFMTGFVIDNKQVWGRPVGVTVAADGSLLVSDDGSNSIWRIVYTAKN